jgi:hypothetical protein
MLVTYPCRCAVTSGDWSCLASCTQLMHLHCCNSPMRGFLRLPPLPHLRSVDVSGSDISGCDGLPGCPLLERVVLFNTQMAEAPPAGVVMGSLCELFLNNCRLTWVRESPSLPLLRYLSLADNRCCPLPRLDFSVHLPYSPPALPHVVAELSGCRPFLAAPRSCTSTSPSTACPARRMYKASHPAPSCSVCISTTILFAPTRSTDLLLLRARRVLSN